MMNHYSHVLEGMNQRDANPSRFTVTLGERDAYLLPADIFIIRVEHGGAWVSYRGEDRILYNGQKMRFFGDSHQAIVTALGSQPLRLEIIRA